jgi:hypothetical protein
MPRWTPEAKQRQRELIQDFRPWEHSSGAKSSWGKFCCANNGYQSMPKLSGSSTTDEQRNILFLASKALIELLRITLEQRIAPSEQNLRDFRLALTTLHKLGANADDCGKLFQMLIRSYEKGELSPVTPDSEISENLRVAGSALRQIIQESLQGKLEPGEIEPL